MVVSGASAVLELPENFRYKEERPAPRCVPAGRPEHEPPCEEMAMSRHAAAARAAEPDKPLTAKQKRAVRRAYKRLLDEEPG